MLYETTVRKTQPREKQFKLSDAFGLYLLIKPTGSKLWRYDYTFDGKRKTLALGSYPNVTLAKARQARSDARRLLDEGRDPGYHKKVSLFGSSGGTTFAEVVAEYLARYEERDPSPAEATMVKKRWLLTDLIIPVIGHMSIDKITSLDILALLKSVETSGRRETAQRMRSEISAVFRHAVIRKRLLEGFNFHTLLRLPTGIWYSPGVKANVLFFDKRPASREIQTKELWVYDYRTNVHKTLKTKRLTSADFNDFVNCYRERKETERFRRFSYEELAKRDKLNLDIFWLKDDSLEDIDSLPEPDVLAAEIVENLEAALEQFRSVSAELE